LRAKCKEKSVDHFLFWFEICECVFVGNRYLCIGLFKLIGCDVASTADIAGWA